MSVPKQSASADHASRDGLAPLYGFVITDEGPVLYRDLLLWRQALEVERRRPFCERPFGARRRVQGAPVEQAQFAG